MNPQNEPAVNLQATDAYPLEDRSLPANEALTEQQSGLTDSSATALVFVP
jgi:hypothetical protein